MSTRSSKKEEKPQEPQALSLYVRTLWKGVVPIFKCLQCDHFENEEDDIITHVLLHFGENHQEAVLEELLAKQKEG